MRTRRSLEHDAAMARRLAQLGDELSAHSAAGHPRGVRPARPQQPATDLTTAPWWDDHTRLAASRHPPSSSPPVPERLPVAPPGAAGAGRHASSRPRMTGRLGAAQLAAVAVVVAVGLAFTCWWLVRGSAHPAPDLTAAPAQGLVRVSPPVAAVDDPVGTAASSVPPAAPPGQVTVDVAGKVRRPGIAVLDAGARVVDAIKAAGGARPGVDLTGLNLARVLVDGEQVVVGVPVPSGVAAQAVPSSGAPSGPAALVNLNTATEAELDTLPDVGPVTAASILQWRDQHGGFSSVDELLEVDGIGEVTLGKLAPYVTV